MRAPYLRLLGKEAFQALPTAILFAGAIVAWQVYLYTRLGVWEPTVTAVLSAWPLGFLPFWAAWRAFFSMRQEWNGHHMQLLLSLPVPGWFITSSKLLVAIAEIALYGLITITGGLLILLASDLPIAEFLGELEFSVVRVAAVFTLLAILCIAGFATVIQFAYLTGRIVNRMRWLVTDVAFLVGSWALLRVGALLTPLFRWIPEVSFSAFERINEQGIVHTAYFDIAPLPAFLLGVVGLHLLGAWLLERDIEV